MYYLLSAWRTLDFNPEYYNTSFREFVPLKISGSSGNRELESERIASGVPYIARAADAPLFSSGGSGQRIHRWVGSRGRRNGEIISGTPGP
jgi:hypothetical protein